eukprot:COSAG04_NODE_100_length_26314_cov_36.469044_4_plen_205_part_00
MATVRLAIFCRPSDRTGWQCTPIALPALLVCLRTTFAHHADSAQPYANTLTCFGLPAHRLCLQQRHAPRPLHRPPAAADRAALAPDHLRRYHEPAGQRRVPDRSHVPPRAHDTPCLGFPCRLFGVSLPLPSPCPGLGAPGRPLRCLLLVVGHFHWPLKKRSFCFALSADPINTPLRAGDGLRLVRLHLPRPIRRPAQPGSKLQV